MSIFPKSRSRIRREASDWVVRLAEQPSHADRAAFERWRDADRRHAAAYDRIAAIWNEAARLAHTPAVAGVQAHRRPERSRTLGFALAASLAAAVLLSILLLGSRWLPGSASEQEPMILASALGQIRQIALSDGSRLTLDSASRVTATFTSAERKLTLHGGRARFQVAHEARPFVVRAGSNEVLATGTLFDVSHIAGRTTVLLLEGSVEVRTAGEPRKRERLMPGQKLTLAGLAPPERRPAARGEAAWPQRMLEFDDTRLEDAAALANRYSKVQLRIGDARIRDLRVSGAFRATDIAGFAQSLATAFELRVVRQPDESLMLVGPSPGDRALRDNDLLRPTGK